MVKEQTQEPEPTPEPTQEPEPEPVKEPVKKSMLEEARKERKLTENAAALMKTENDRREQLAADEELGGRADAGQAPVKPKEETPAEYKKRVMEGKL